MRITIANPSSQQQDRWVIVAMPLSQATSMPDAVLFNSQFLGVKAKTVGNVSQLWHVRANVPAISELVLTEWEPLTGALPAFEGSTWLTDRPDLADWKINLRDGTQWKWLWCKMSSAELVESSPVSRTFRWKGSDGGWHYECFAVVWSGQDTVDIEGYVCYSDPNTPDWNRPDCTISVESGYWDSNATPQHGGEPLEIYWGLRTGVTRYDEHRSRIYQGQVPHGGAIPFHGAILPRRQTPVAPPITMADRAQRAYEAERIRLLDAASQWPLVAVADWTGSSDWFAFGNVPVTLQKRTAQQVLDYFNQPASMLAPRTCANNVSHGATGMQAPFGAMKDAIALNGNAWRMLELLHGADQYWYRGCHLRESDGRRTTKEIRPTLETWAGMIESRVSPDKFGKPQGYANATWGGSFTTEMDDQHRGCAFAAAAYALTGSLMRKALLLDLLATDEMRAMPKRGWMDSPRASARLWQSWAKMAMLIPEAQDRIKAIATAELASREAQLPTAGNPVIAFETFTSLLPGKKAVQGWQHALLCLGALEQAACWRKLGDTILADRFASLARQVGASVIAWQIVTTNGQLQPTYATHWLDGGVAHPATFYVLPRSDSQSNIVEADNGWWSWYSGAVVADNSARAAQIKARHSSSNDPMWQEWWAL